MSATARWDGLIARFWVETTDHRMLEMEADELIHFGHMPLPLYARYNANGAVMEVVGMVERVHLVDFQPTRSGRDLTAEGSVDLDVLFRLRPDLEKAYGAKGAIEPWPVGIMVDGGEFVFQEDILIVKGPWRLTGMAIEEQPSVWPGVGITPTRIKLEAAK